MRMLILQKDYVIVELNKDAGTWSTEEWMWPRWWLEFTVQCNGKLKKHTTGFNVKDLRPTTKDAPCSSNMFDIMNYYPIYEAIHLLESLWYQLTTEEIIPQIEAELKWTAE
jgi:hypothetical protein